MDVLEAQNNRYNGTAAIWFTSHAQIDARDWNNIQEFKGDYHPLVGYYRSDDPQVLDKQLRWMRRAGVDLIVYDVYGFGRWNLTDLPNDKVLPMLVEALSHQQNEARKLKLVIWLEKYAANPSLEQYRYALDTIRDQFAQKDFYFQYQGKPLVVTYHNGQNDAIDEIEWENQFFSLRRIRPYYSDVLAYVDHYPQRLNREWMPASPGFDAYLEEAYLAKYFRKEPDPDYAAIRQRCHSAGREDGKFYEKQLLRARQGDPKIIFISGWNDWQYANQVEPAVEYRFKYVDMTARLLGREAETQTYKNMD